MRATGIIRRIDDLGRVVIPKEIRRTMRIHDGDPFELFIDGNKVCFQKYDTTEQPEEMVQDLINLIKEGFDIKCSKEVLLKLNEVIDILKSERQEAGDN